MGYLVSPETFRFRRTRGQTSDMSPNGGVKPLSCISRAWALGRSWCGWSAVAGGSPSGCAGFGRQGGRGFSPGVGRRNGDRGAPQRRWWAKCWRFVRSSQRIAPAPRALQGLGPRRSGWSWSGGGFGPCLPLAPSSGSSGDMATLSGLPIEGRVGASRIRPLGQNAPGISSRPIWGALGTSVAPEESPGFTRPTRSLWWAEALPPARAATKRLGSSASISCAPGAGWGSRGSPSSTTRWPPPGEAVIPSPSRWSCGCICCWASIWSSSPRGSPAETPTWRASTISGRNGSSGSPVPISAPSGGPMRPSCATTLPQAPSGPAGLRGRDPLSGSVA